MALPMIVEQPVTFMNRNGFRLFGMTYSPAAAVSARIGIVISVNAIKYRLGTFGLHVLLARHLAQRGYVVLTFDPEGIGDSEGTFDHKLLSEHYYDIQTGKYTGDLRDAVGFLAESALVDEVILLGLCGGAIATIMEAADDDRVRGLVLLNLPVLVEDLKRQGQPDNARMITSSASAATLLSLKARKLFQLRFWRRVVRLDVHFGEELRLVSRSFAVLGTRVAKKCLSFLGRSSSSIDAAKPVSSHRLFNLHFQSAFRKSMAMKQRVLFVFAELDPWTAIFKSEFQEPALKPGNPHEPNYQIDTIAASNHIFSGRESCSQLTAIIVRWLTAKFPVSIQERVNAPTSCAHE
jgi:pimeloyl-ACP methyl ester carboxylesterase